MISSAAFSQKKQAMVRGGKILSAVVKALKPFYQPGITTAEIDAQATQFINKFGGQLSFNKVAGYTHATCLSVNEVIVHGVPGSYRLKNGDILKLDIGVYYGGYHVDYGNTYLIGKGSLEQKRFLEVGKETLKKILPLPKQGIHIGVVSQTIEKNIIGAGYQVIYELTGHTVGKELHEEPYIPGFLDRELADTPQFEVGKAYALEVIYSMKDRHVTYANDDGWSLRTKKKSLSACFENTVFIDQKETLVLVEEKG